MLISVGALWAEAGNFSPYPSSLGGLDSPKPPAMSALVGGNGAGSCHRQASDEHTAKEFRLFTSPPTLNL